RFTRVYKELKILRKTGEIRYTLTFANTITYQGKPAGFVVLIDITRQKRLESIVLMLREVNQTITSSLTEEEVFEKICKNLVEKIGLRFVWVGFPDWETLLIKPKYYYGYEAGLFEKIKVSVRGDVPEGRGALGTGLRENRIVIISDIRTDPRFYPWREEVLKRQYLSVAGIPIYKNGNPYCVLGLYAKEPNFFTDETLGLLEELRGDIEFALKRIEEIRNNVIISQALIKSPAAMVVLDEKGRIIFCNETVSKSCGFTFEELYGKSLEILGLQGLDYDFNQTFFQVISQEDKEFSDILFCTKNNIYLQTKIYPLRISEKERRYLLIGRDVSTERELISKLEKVTTEDLLTGLLNLDGLEKRVNQILERVDEGCLIVLDIFNFVYINQTYGFETGNRILKELGSFFKNLFKKSNQFTARIGSDEFACFLEKEEYHNIQGLIEKLSLIKEMGFNIDGQEIALSTNIGISFYPQDGTNFRDLLEKASLALSEAKKFGAGEFRFFAQSMELKAQEIVSLDYLFEKALKENLFVFYYQPYFKVEDLSLAGLEALVRIKVDDTVYNPSQFIDYLERSRFLPKFEEWMFEEISKKTERFRVPISVNISARSFNREDFIERFLSRFQHKEVRLEITERVFIENILYAKEILKRIKEKNIKVMIDDFGTGYCALSYLRFLPIDVIKIDMSFIKDIIKNKKDKDLVEVIVLLAQKLGIETLAERVETQGQLDIIKQIGCTYVQGFLFDKPLPEEELLVKYPFIAGVAE
ncbi:MAG TPA: hypothetical protein DCE01_05135, partial [Thermodesulfobacterium commune]|nr:hypothetical protein [Thermodesulfobacterium commune]